MMSQSHLKISVQVQNRTRYFSLAFIKLCEGSTCFYRIPETAVKRILAGGYAFVVVYALIPVATQYFEAVSPGFYW